MKNATILAAGSLNLLSIEDAVVETDAVVLGAARANRVFLRDPLSVSDAGRAKNRRVEMVLR